MPKKKNVDEEIYLRFIVTPSTSDEILLTKSIHDAMDQSFGLSRAYTFFDIVWNSQSGSEFIIRAALMYVSL